MTPITTEALTELLNWAREAKGFASEQMPLLAEEIIRWEIVSGIGLPIAMFFTSVLLLAMAFAFGTAHERTHNGRYEAMAGICAWPGIAVLLLTIPVGLTGAVRAAKACAAPRIVVVERLAEMVGVRP
jgi:hypothetical protein